MKSSNYTKVTWSDDTIDHFVSGKRSEVAFISGTLEPVSAREDSSGESGVKQPELNRQVDDEPTNARAAIESSLEIITSPEMMTSPEIPLIGVERVKTLERSDNQWVIQVHESDHKLERMKTYHRRITMHMKKHRPETRYLLGMTDEMHATLLCLPLAVCSIVIAAVFLSLGIYEVYSALKDSGVNLEDLGDVCLGGFKIVAGLVGFTAVPRKSVMAVNCQVVAYDVTLISMIISFLTKWLEWVMARTGNTQDPWTPSHDDLVFIMWHGIEMLLFLLISFAVVLGSLSSLRAVIEVGGTGWERKNHMQILTDRGVDAVEQQLEERRQEYTVNQSITAKPFEFLTPPRPLHIPLRDTVRAESSRSLRVQTSLEQQTSLKPQTSLKQQSSLKKQTSLRQQTSMGAGSSNNDSEYGSVGGGRSSKSHGYSNDFSFLFRDKTPKQVSFRRDLEDNALEFNKVSASSDLENPSPPKKNEDFWNISR